MGALVGAVVGLPALRLKHLYLAIATLAFQQIFQWGVGHSPLLLQGQVMSLPRPVVFGTEIGYFQHNVFWYYVSLTLLVLLSVAWRNILRSRYGRALVAVRDNDRAADAMGINPGTTKVLAFAMGSFCAVAGALYAYLYRGAQVEDYTLPVSIKFLAMAIVGGLGSLPGASSGPPSSSTSTRGRPGLGTISPGCSPRWRGWTSARPCARSPSASSSSSSSSTSPGPRELLAAGAQLLPPLALQVLGPSVLRTRGGEPPVKGEAMKRTLGTLAILGLLAALGSAPAQQKTINLGWSGAITGPTSDAGSKYALGISDYCRYANDRNLVAGYDLRCEVRDDNYDNSKTQRNVEDFSQNVKVAGFLGYSTAAAYR
jgi:hypothetical protein